jgi:peptidoglycan/LPS O-acetylase OafA/YrhL
MLVAWWLSRHRTPAWGVRAAAIGAVVMLVVSRVAESTDTFLPTRDISYGLAFAMLLLVAVERASLLRDGWFLRGIGEYSYSIYLFHMAIIEVVCAALARTSLGPLGRFGVALLSFPLILAFSKLAFFCFEKPFLKTSPSKRPKLPLAVEEYAAP